jgi:hypothetical protein
VVPFSQQPHGSPTLLVEETDAEEDVDDVELVLDEDSGSPPPLE